MTCCYNCADRVVGCHAGCERYGAFASSRKAEKKQKYLSKDIENYHYEMVRKSRAIGDEIEKRRKRGLAR